MQLIKCKLYFIELESNLDELAKIMQKEAYLSNKRNGFLIDILNHSNLSGQYIEEYIHEELVLNPYGEETKISIKKFIIINFDFSIYGKNKFVLRIDNTPRGVKQFIDKLNNSINKSMIIFPIIFDINNVLLLIKENNNIRRVEIKELCVSSIFINKNTFAKINLYSEKDALNDFNEHFKFKQFNFDSFKCGFYYNQQYVDLEIRKSGLIIITGHAISLLYQFI